MNETVTTERARELLGSDYVKHIPDIRDLIAEALAGREFDEQCEADLATVESSAVDGAMRYFRVALENVKLRQRIAELTASLAAASYPGHYISTACQGGLHDQCRHESKWRHEPCLCKCGHGLS